jgi:PIN domain nuclease of toxin-antitoxin system
MGLLLDTHVLLPLIEERADTLHPSIRGAIRSPGVSLFASVVSLWEIAIKTRIGKLPLEGPLALLPDLIELAGVKVLIIEASHVLAEIDPMPATRDPFDRLLLAQCRVEQLRLLTLDKALAAHPLAWQAG